MMTGKLASYMWWIKQVLHTSYSNNDYTNCLGTSAAAARPNLLKKALQLLTHAIKSPLAPVMQTLNIVCSRDATQMTTWHMATDADQAWTHDQPNSA